MGSNLYYWMCLLIASVFEVLWLITIRYLDFSQLIAFQWTSDFKKAVSIVVPFICYLAFGLSNVYFFSISTKKIPMAVGFATWVSIALVITSIIDMTYYKVHYNYMQMLFIVVILLGVIGLKISTN